MRHRLSIDGQLLVLILHDIARQAHHALDVIDIRIDRITENHDIAPTRMTDIDNFVVDEGQAYAVLEFIHQNQVAVLQGGEHGTRLNGKSVDYKGAQGEDDITDGKDTDEVFNQPLHPHAMLVSTLANTQRLRRLMD